MPPFEVLILDLSGNQRRQHFASEEELIEYLRTTYQTEAPLSITYSNASPVPREILDRIYRRLFGQRE